MNEIYQGERSKNLYLPTGYRVGRYEIREVPLENLLCMMWGSHHKHKIRETPHYRYAKGNPSSLQEYFLSCRGQTWARKGTPHENMTVEELCGMFNELLDSDKKYLEPPYDDRYIIVNGRDWTLIDGVRRTCTLLANGIETAPVAWVY